MSDLVEELQETGINAEDYKRGPLGKSIFTITVRPVSSEGTVKVWQGNAEIEIATSKKFRQAVLAIDEPKRTITRRFTFEGARPVGMKHKQFQAVMEARARRNFEVQVRIPSRARISCSFEEVPRTETFNPHVIVDVKATVPRTSQTLLLGMDETYHFIAALPERVTSVADAHKVLKPAAAEKPRTLRQGEWFFVPVSSELNDKLHEYARKHQKAVQYNNLEARSTHQAQRLIYRNKTYAIGLIMDTRRSHHVPLWLSKWHMVVRNLETVVRSGQAFRRYWD